MKALAIVLLLAWSGSVIDPATPLAQELQPSTWQAKYRSGRIDALKRQLASGMASTDAFWREVAAEGTPLVEPAESGDKHQILTFVWRGAEDTRNVLVVMNPFTLFAPRDYLMTRLVGTDVWYLTVRVPRGARFTYQLSPDDPMAGPTPSAASVRANAQGDPLNPRRWSCGPDASLTQCSSIVELPDAMPQPWITPRGGTKPARLESHRFKSDILKNERDVWVYVPSGYRSEGEPCALLVLFDGRAYSTLVPTPTILDNLIAASMIPSTIAVLVGDSERGRELVPNPALADSIAKELVPWIRTQYHVSADPRRMIIGGSSAGGFVAIYTALHHPEVFGNVLGQSPAAFRSPELARYFAERAPASVPGNRDRHDLEELLDRGLAETTGWLANEVIDRPKMPLRFYLDAGLFEVDFTGFAIGILESTRYLRDVLRAKGYDVRYQMFVGGHEYVNWRGTLADGLIALLGTDRAAK
jgi:enterochelin esterase family protein